LCPSHAKPLAPINNAFASQPRVFPYCTIRLSKPRAGAATVPVAVRVECAMSLRRVYCHLPAIEITIEFGFVLLISNFACELKQFCNRPDYLAVEAIRRPFSLAGLTLLLLPLS
jgi:hypothetical protein